MARKAAGAEAWKALQPFSFYDGTRDVRVERGDDVPEGVLANDALRLRLLRAKKIFDPAHPESYGMDQPPVSRMARLSRDAALPVGPVEQDREVDPAVVAQRRIEGDERARQLNYRLNNPSPWQPTKRPPDAANPTGAYPPAGLGG